MKKFEHLCAQPHSLVMGYPRQGKRRPFSLRSLQSYLFFPHVVAGKG